MYAFYSAAKLQGCFNKLTLLYLKTTANIDKLDQKKKTFRCRCWWECYRTSARNQHRDQYDTMQQLPAAYESVSAAQTLCDACRSLSADHPSQMCLSEQNRSSWDRSKKYRDMALFLGWTCFPACKTNIICMSVTLWNACKLLFNGPRNS